MASPNAGNNSNSVKQLLKLWYKDGGLTYSTYQNRPYWTLLTKRPDSSMVEGDTFQFAIQTNDVQARNTVFAAGQSQAWGLSGYQATNALTNSTAGAPNGGNIAVTQFSVSRVENYAYASISTVLELQTRTKRGAFESAANRVIASALNTLGNDQEISLFGGNVTTSGVSTASTGIIGQIGAGTTVGSALGVLVLGTVGDVQKFNFGQELDVYFNNAGVITKRTNVGGHGLFVGNIDRVQGFLYIVNAAGAAVSITSTFSDAVVGDFLCVTNDFNQGAATGTQGNGKIAGFEAWCPFGGPLSDSSGNPFMGVNRNTGDIVRLAGNWLDATGQLGPSPAVLNIEDAILGGLNLQRLNSDKEIDTIAMNYNQVLKLNKSNMNRVTLPGGMLQTKIPGLGFKGFQVETDMGVSTVLPSRYCGSNRLYLLSMPTWAYTHLGEPVETYTQDGLDGLREPMMDAKGYRFFSFGNVVCDEPSANCTVNISAV